MTDDGYNPDGSDAQLPKDYDPSSMSVAQEGELSAEEERVLAASSAADPGEDYDVEPPTEADAEADPGYDPTPPEVPD